MTATQNFIPIKEIKDNLVFLNDGTVNLCLLTSAVNFGLLFETEQISIIESFAGLLNSLSFPIQIVILSKRLDVSSYLKTLDQALTSQTNPKLRVLSSHYRQFIESIIKEKNVLDKQFYVCLSVNPVEIGILSKSSGDKSKKAATILAPRRDHLIRQLARLGLKTKQLTTPELVKLFHDIYNPVTNEKLNIRREKLDKEVESLKVENPTSNLQPQGLILNPQHPISNTPAPPPLPPLPPVTSNLHSPFVVEELADD